MVSRLTTSAGRNGRSSARPSAPLLAAALRGLGLQPAAKGEAAPEPPAGPDYLGAQTPEPSGRGLVSCGPGMAPPGELAPVAAARPAPPVLAPPPPPRRPSWKPQGDGAP